MLGHGRRHTRQPSRLLLLLGLGSAPLTSCTFPDFRTPLSDAVGGCRDAGCAASGGGQGAAAASGGTTASGAGTSGVGGSDTGLGGEGLAGAPGTELGPGELDGVYEMVAEHSSKCLDPTAPATMQQMACNGAATQTFTLKNAGDGLYSIGIDASIDCMDIAGAMPGDGSPVVRNPCDGRESETWQPLLQTDGSYLIVNGSSSKCLDVFGASKNDGQLVEGWSCSGAPNQRWFLSSRVPARLPLVVDEFFSVDTQTTNGAAPFTLTPAKNGDSTDCNGARAPNASGSCHIIALDVFPQGANHLSAHWIYPDTAAGAAPGLLIAAGAAKVHFQARGQKGGESVVFGAGGVTGATFNDGFKTGALNVVLTNSWQSYELDLSAQAYPDGVITAFIAAAQLGSNQAPLTFYVDDLVWE